MYCNINETSNSSFQEDENSNGIFEIGSQELSGWPVSEAPVPSTPTQSSNSKKVSQRIQYQCMHCQCTSSTKWCRLTSPDGMRDRVLCSKCKKYWKQHGEHRPLDGDKKCTNCETTSSYQWITTDKNELLCNTCGKYWEQNGQHLSRICTRCKTTATLEWRRGSGGILLCRSCKEREVRMSQKETSSSQQTLKQGGRKTSRTDSELSDNSDEGPKKKRTRSDYGLLGRVFNAVIEGVFEFGYTISGKIDGQAYKGVILNASVFQTANGSSDLSNFNTCSTEALLGQKIGHSLSQDNMLNEIITPELLLTSFHSSLSKMEDDSNSQINDDYNSSNGIISTSICTNTGTPNKEKSNMQKIKNALTQRLAASSTNIGSVSINNNHQANGTLSSNNLQSTPIIHSSQNHLNQHSHHVPLHHNNNNHHHQQPLHHLQYNDSDDNLLQHSNDSDLEPPSSYDSTLPPSLIEPPPPNMNHTQPPVIPIPVSPSSSLFGTNFQMINWSNNNESSDDNPHHLSVEHGYKNGKAPVPRMYGKNKGIKFIQQLSDCDEITSPTSAFMKPVPSPGNLATTPTSAAAAAEAIKWLLPEPSPSTYKIEHPKSSSTV